MRSKLERGGGESPFYRLSINVSANKIARKLSPLYYPHFSQVKLYNPLYMCVTCELIFSQKKNQQRDLNLIVKGREQLNVIT